MQRGTNVCFGFGKSGHLIKDFPQNKGQAGGNAQPRPNPQGAEALDLPLRHDASSLITEVYQDIGLKHFMHTLRMPQIYLYSLPLDCELCAFLILQLYRSMLEHIIDKECACPLGFLFAQKQA